MDLANLDAVLAATANSVLMGNWQIANKWEESSRWGSIWLGNDAIDNPYFYPLTTSNPVPEPCR